MKILIASDHAGFELKKPLMAAFPQITWEDLGTNNLDSVDYPDFADRLCQKMISENLTNEINKESKTFGILICGSGQGMAIRANRYPAIRAALCWNADIAKLSREHNNANILVLPGRFLKLEEACALVKIFSETSFAGGRHSGRVDKLSGKLSAPC